MDNKKKVLVYGTFDLLHAGHFNLLYKASKLGEVIVALRPMEEVWEKKGVQLFQNNEIRKNNLNKLIIVSEVVIASWDYETQVNLIKKYGIDIVVAGHDHQDSEIHQKTAQETGAEVIIFERTTGISSSFLREVTKNG